MKVLLLGSKEYPFGSSYIYDRKAGGGIEVHVDKLAKFLAKEGNEVTIITRQFPGQKKEETVGMGPGKVVIYRTRFLYNPLLRAMTFNLFAFMRALRIARKRRADIIHCHGPVAGFFGGILSKMTGVPMAFTPHGTVSTWSSPLREILKFFEWFSVMSARKTLFISKTAQRELSLLGNFPNALLTNAIEMEEYAVPAPETRANKNFIFLGRLEEVKGIRQLLDAFAMLVKERPDARLSIAGDGVMRDYVLDFIKQNNMENAVKFLGWITDVPSKLAENDVFVLPSWERGQPVALLEAMASSKLIITSLDYIEDGVSGLKTRPKDTEDLYRKMLYAYDNPGCAEMGKNARALAKQASWEAVVKSFLKEYETVKGSG